MFNSTFEPKYLSGRAHMTVRSQYTSGSGTAKELACGFILSSSSRCLDSISGQRTEPPEFVETLKPSSIQNGEDKRSVGE